MRAALNHQHDQARAPAAPATTAQHHGSLDPGRSSRSALLRKPDHAVASGLTHHVPGDHAPEPLAAAQQSQMSRAYGFDFSGVLIRRDSPAATGATRALFKDGEIHFRQGEYRPGTPDGDRLIAHELAHVVQQRGGRGERTGSREELEREADHAASLAARGQPAPIALRADPSASYAFHDGEDHDEPLDDTADEAAPDHATHDQDADNESPDRAKQRRKNRAIGPDGAARDRAKQDGPHQRITAQQPSTTQSANKLLDRKKLDDKKPSGASKASVAQRNDRHAGDPHQNQVAADAAKRREPAAGTAKHGNAIANPASQSQPYASRSNRGDTPANHPTHSDANRVVAKANDSHASPANHGAQPDHPLTNEPRASHANHDVAKPSGSMPAPLATGERTGAGIERGDASRASSFATPSSPSGGTPLPATSRRGSAGDTVPAIDTRDPATLLESLAQAPPSRAAVTLAQVHRAAPRAFEAQREHAQAAIPRVPAPTGLPPRTAPRSRIALNSTPGPAPADSPKPKTGDAVSVPRTVVPEAPAAAAQAPNTLPGPRSNAEQGGNQDAALARSTQHAIASISAPVHHVPSRANGMPSVRLRGECDPDQIDSAHAVSADQMRTATHQAALDARRDFGENDILPAANNQVLSATLPARAVTVSSAGKPSPTLDLPPDAVASLDANASPFLREAIGAQQRRYAQGKAQHDAQIQTEHTRHRADVAKLEQEARAKQQAARADSRVTHQIGGSSQGTQQPGTPRATAGEPQGRRPHARRRAQSRCREAQGGRRRCPQETGRHQGIRWLDRVAEVEGDAADRWDPGRHQRHLRQPAQGGEAVL
ncbi:MAG: DUF4157 domain-containing protein [Deltaproteobacteria bacterium]|nr:MAG: DUF4157 domain-containing protein [Deltaproteobacteria bacterium]